MPHPDPTDLPTELLPGADARPASRRLVATWNGGSLLRDLPGAGRLTIGRGQEADIRIDHTSVSRSHATLILGETMRIEDLGSSNGTWVDGRRLEPNGDAVVRPGLLVELGSVLMLVQDPPSVTSAGVAAADPTREGVVVCDPQMEQVHQLVDLVGKSSLSVVLLGETGVGKEVLASRIHRMSPRATKPYLKVNCAALVESLLEAELFGYERGAFTGAVQAKPGLLEGAHGGTLFLDEVGDLPPSIQAKLLRVLEGGEVTRLGSLKARAVDVRFVSATNRNLKELVAEGKFREDLLFRLDGVSIQIPPLRERTAEILAIAEAFLVEASVKANRASVVLTEDARARLLRHPWPGNVRELRNVIARSVVLCPSDTIAGADLRFDAMGAAATTAPPQRPNTVFEADRQRVIDALEKSAGNQTSAAKLLGMSRRALLNRLDALGLPRPRKRGEPES